MRRMLAISAVALFLASATSIRAADVSVDSLDLANIHQATGAKPAGTINGKKPDHAITITPPGLLAIDTKGAASSFSTSVALDDASGADALARFYVIGDGKLLAESGIMKKGDAPKPLTADLKG